MNKLYITLLCVIASLCVANADQCPALEKGKEAAVTEYIQKRYGFPANDRLTVTETALVGETCYRRFNMESEKLKRSFVVYLSPDQRYIVTQVMDLTKDPEVEERKSSMLVQRTLLADASPSRGESDAPVTVVEFSDFAYPFCARFTSLFDSLPDAEKRKVRLVFKQYPLPMHAWAARAAEIAVCAGQQGDQAFWKTHDFLFQHSKGLRIDNIQAQFAEFAAKNSGIDAQQVETCIAKNAADQVLARDRVLATKFAVRGTPTLFINGKRMPGFRSAAELSELIERLAAETGADRERSGPAVKSPLTR